MLLLLHICRLSHLMCWSCVYLSCKMVGWQSSGEQYIWRDACQHLWARLLCLSAGGQGNANTQRLPLVSVVPSFNGDDARLMCHNKCDLITYLDAPLLCVLLSAALHHIMGWIIWTAHDTLMSTDMSNICLYPHRSKNRFCRSFLWIKLTVFLFFSLVD